MTGTLIGKILSGLAYMFNHLYRYIYDMKSKEVRRRQFLTKIVIK
jgi:hypothetical protein